MMVVKRIPWLPLLLLLASYSTFSWFLYRSTASPRLVLLGAALFALVQALLLTTFFSGVRAFLRGWLQSDLGYFSMVLLGAMSITVFLVWYHIFEYILVVVGAEILSRLELQNAKYNEWQALAILTSISLAGLAVGWTASHLWQG